MTHTKENLLLQCLAPQWAVACIEGLEGEIAKLEAQLAKLDVPEIDNFLLGVKNEAPHQLKRWGKQHDVKKSPDEWIFLFGWLTGKATQARKDGNHDKAKHHAITAAAALFNWHSALHPQESTP